MRFLSTLLLIVVISSCGTEQEEQKSEPKVATTPFGSADEVRKYMQVIDPFIVQASSIHKKIYTAVGTSSSATGENLTTVIKEIDAITKMKDLINNFNQITPPPLLAPLHRNMEKLMILRADSYKLAEQGWRLEAEDQGSELYQQSEDKLKQANALSLELNHQLEDVNKALHTDSPAQQQAGSH